MTKVTVGFKQAQKALSRGGKVEALPHIQNRLYGAIRASKGHLQYLEVPTAQNMGYAIIATDHGMVFSQGAGGTELRVTIPMAESVAKSIVEEIQHTTHVVVPMLCHQFIKGVQQSVRVAA